MHKIVLFLAVMVFATVACTQRTVVEKKTVIVKKDNGKHKGWYKNPNNPHHPSNQSTQRTTVVVEESHGKGKGKKHK